MIVKRVNSKLKDYIGGVRAPQPHNKLTPTLGCIERFFYTILFYTEGYQLIGGLFALMAAQKIISIYRIPGEDKQSGDRLSLYKEAMEKTNVYFISAFISLFFGFLGSYLIKLYQDIKL